MNAQPLLEERATPLTCSPLLGAWSERSHDHSALEQEKGRRGSESGRRPCRDSQEPQAPGREGGGDGASPGRGLGERTT